MITSTTTTSSSHHCAPVSSAPADDAASDPRLALFWILRIACACEFIGHGAFGIITKPEWVPYFAVAHVHPQAAYHWMPIVGAVDISLGLLTWWRPCRAQLLYMALWGLWTASLRPLSGESAWEMLERAPNCLVPLALLLVMGLPWSLRSWFLNPRLASETAERSQLEGAWPSRLPLWTLPRSLTIELVLRLASAGAFIGHGAYGVFLHKAGWYPCFSRLGISPLQVHEHHLILVVGGLEMLLGAAALVAPFEPLLALLVVWKFGIELLWFPLAGKPIWELVERAANYAAPLALLVVRRSRRPPRRGGS